LADDAQRSNGTFYSEDTETHKQKSLRTKDEAEAQTLLHSKNEASRQPILNQRIALAYLSASDAEAAIKARDGFAGQSSGRTWLTGILRHKIYDHLRRACRERAVRVEVPVTHDGDEPAWKDALMWVHDVAAESQSPSRRMELAEFRANLELALGKLPARVALLLKLRSRGAALMECPPFAAEQLKLNGGA
jgi:RNA polymerase sigma factor (sigma-70 family)